MVLFGHDHTRHAETITNVAGKQVVCLDPANNAMSVADAEITVTIDEHQLHGKKLHILQNKSVEGKIADVTDCPVDEKMLKIFEPQIAEVDKYVSKQIGTFKNTIYSRDSYFEAAPSTTSSSIWSCRLPMPTLPSMLLCSSTPPYRQALSA